MTRVIIMTSINVCESIKCPYFHNHVRANYGCQRYPRSEYCHLTRINQFESNEYALFIPDEHESRLSALQKENNNFFRDDADYIEKLEFQRENPDWFTPNSFQVKEITELV